MKIAITLAVLLAASAAGAAPHICNADAKDAFKKQFLNASAEGQRQQRHHWMALARAAAPKFASARIDQLLIPGSHDAGSFGTPSSGTGKNAWAVTQTYSLLDQLCLGSRWFDVRLEKTTDGWRIFHGNFKFATGAQTLEQFAKFVEDPAHADEFFFVRLKLEGKPAEKAALYTEWLKRLGGHAVDKTRLPKANQSLGGFAHLTPAQIKAAGTGKGGRVFLLEYEKSGTHVPAPLRKHVFSYTQDQSGTFSDKVPLADVTTAQKANLTEFKSGTDKKGKGSDKVGKAFATWWTSTGGVGRLDVRNNTTAFWPKNKPSPGTPLEAFYASNGCAIGSFLIVDFFGDTALQNAKTNLVMDIAFDHSTRGPAGLKPKLCANQPVAQDGGKGKGTPAKDDGKGKQAAPVKGKGKK